MELFYKAAAETLKAAGQGYIPCLFHTLTGLYCPGCGGTRAVFALVRGQVLLSLCYHPLPAYLAAVIPALMLYFFYCCKKKKTFSQRVWKNALFFGFGLLILNFVIKNYCLLVHGFDILVALDMWG